MKVRGDPLLGYLAACNVKPNALRDDDKFSARQYALTVAKTSIPRVIRHYEAWEMVADQGLVPHADILTMKDTTPTKIKAVLTPEVKEAFDRAYLKVQRLKAGKEARSNENMAGQRNRV